MKLFDAVSMEEQSLPVEALTLDDAIAMEEASVEMEFTGKEVLAGVATMESALEVTAIMADQIAVEEKILAAGEVSQGAAQLAMQSLQANAKMLGLEEAAFAVSAESIEQNPTGSLKVSIESKMETLKNVLTKIANFFKNLAQKAKKFIGKALISIGGYEKKFKLLEEAAGKLGEAKKDDAGKYSEKESAKIAAKFFHTLAAKKGLVDGSKVVADLDIVNSISNAILASSKSKENSEHKIETFTPNYDGLPEVKDGDTMLVVSKATGTSLRGIIFKSEEVSVGDEKMVKVGSTAFSATAKKDVVKELAKKIELLSVADIKTIAKAGAENAKKAKDFTKSADDVLDTVAKTLEKKDLGVKEANEKAASGIYSTMVSSLSTSALKFATDAVFGYKDVLSNTAYLVSLSNSKYEAKK